MKEYVSKQTFIVSKVDITIEVNRRKLRGPEEGTCSGLGFQGSLSQGGHNLRTGGWWRKVN